MKILLNFFYIYIISINIACIEKEKCTNLNSKPNTIPALQEWKPSCGEFHLSDNTSIVIDNKYLSLAKTFIKDLNSISGFNFTTKKSGAQNGDISILIDNNLKDISKEAYTIQIDDKIEIKASDQSGAFYATQTLLQILVQDKSGLKIPKGAINDYPKIKERAFMIDIGRKYFSINYIKKTIRNLAWYKQNTFHIHFSDWSGFRLKSNTFSGLASEQAYSKSDIKEIQEYAKTYNVTIVPEIDLPAHATKILKYNPDLGFECESMITCKWLPDSVNAAKPGWILNVKKPEAKTFVKDLLDEFIPLFDGPYFHIGGDEWQFDSQKETCKELMDYTKKRGFKYPGDAYVEWINEINKQVKSYGKITQIWNWWRYSPSKDSQNKTTIQPDKDIIINVWNKPRTKPILNDGYNVIITPEEGTGSLYISPGFNGKKAGDYGYFDSKYNYETWKPEIENNQIKGYKICMWSDRCETKKDEWFDQFSEKPKAVFAEKVWGTKDSETVTDFFERMNRIGLAPKN